MEYSINTRSKALLSVQNVAVSMSWEFQTNLTQLRPFSWVAKPKVVGPSTTLAWPGWKQPDIPVEVDTARLETYWFKNGFAKCVLLYYPSSEFESTFNAYWNCVGAAGLSCTELSIWEFPFLRGGGAVGSGGKVYDIVWMGCPRRKPWKCCFRILSTSFTSVSIFSVCCYSSVSISVDIPARQATKDGHGSSICRLALLYGYSAERG